MLRLREGDFVRLKDNPHYFKYGASSILSGALVRVARVVGCDLSVRVITSNGQYSSLVRIHEDDISHMGVSPKFDAVLDEFTEWDREPREPSEKVKVTMLSKPTFILVNQNL